jgi:predicted nucleotidyltransferase
MASTLELLKRLTDHRVEFVLVGGMAATLHGSALVRQDVDVCTHFSQENVERILAALEGLNPRQRMVSGRPALSTDAAAYTGWPNLYVTTDLGQLDFLGQITGVGNYTAVSRGAVEVDLGGFRCRVMGLDDLIQAKRSLGRPKDLRSAEELEAVRRRLLKR